MSGVIHPTGPEEPQTYWVRRVGVVVAVLVVVLVVAWAWPRGGGSGGDAVPASDPSPSTSTTTSASADPTPSAPTASTTTASTARPTTSPSVSTSATPGATPKAGASPTPSASARKSVPAASTTPSAPTTPAVTACAAKDLHVTLTGNRSVTIAKLTTFKLSVINGGDGPCRLSIDAKTFELKIYSGTDRIWSTQDCDTWLKPIKNHTLASQQEVDWTQDWPAQRSHSGCKLADNLRPGTYVATAQLTVPSGKVTPVQLVLTLNS